MADHDIEAEAAAEAKEAAMVAATAEGTTGKSPIAACKHANFHWHNFVLPVEVKVQIPHKKVTLIMV